MWTVVVLLSINRELKRSLHFASSTLFYYFTLYINILFIVCRLYCKIVNCVISDNWRKLKYMNLI